MTETIQSCQRLGNTTVTVIIQLFFQLSQLIAKVEGGLLVTVEPGPFRGKSVNAIVARLRPLECVQTSQSVRLPVEGSASGTERECDSWPEVLNVGVMC